MQLLTPDGPRPLAGPALGAAAAAIASLRTAPQIDSKAVTWGSATLLRATTRGGIALSLQVKPIADGVAVRVTADAPATAAGRAEASSIRTLRLNAYRLAPAAAAPLLPAAPAESGN